LIYLEPLDESALRLNPSPPPVSSGARRPSPRSRQAEEAVPGEDGGARPRQPAGGEPRGRGQEAATEGGGAQEGVGTGRGRGRTTAVHGVVASEEAVILTMAPIPISANHSNQPTAKDKKQVSSNSDRK